MVVVCCEQGTFQKKKKKTFRTQKHTRMPWSVRARTDHRFFVYPKFTKYNTFPHLKVDKKLRPYPKYNGLLKWQHVAVALRKNGPMTFTKMWNKVKGISGMRHMLDLKCVLQKMRGWKMLRVSPPAEGNLKKQRWYFYLPPYRSLWQFKYPQKMERVVPAPKLPFKVFPYQKPTPLDTYNMQTANFLKEMNVIREEKARKLAVKIAKSFAKAQEKKKAKAQEKKKAAKTQRKRKQRNKQLESK